MTQSIESIAVRSSAARVVVGIAVPLIVAAVAFLLWWLSDRLLFVGPLDRATFGWIVVVPMWLAVPLASALAWRGLDTRARSIVASAVGLVAGGATALFLGQAVASPDCQYGAIRGPEAWIGPVLVIGAVMGGGLAWSSTVASSQLAARHTARAIFVGLAIQAGVMFVAILVFTAFTLTTPQCQRPA
jgi:hypothetical protein